MSNLIKPTTLSGIKRLAKTIKQEQSILHTRALDIAANRAGYENYAHARHSLSKKSISKQAAQRMVTINVMWREKEKSNGFSKN